MAAKLLDGKLASEALLKSVKEEAAALSTMPSLAIVSIGENHASQIYMKKKLEACQKVGFAGELVRLPSGVSIEEATRVLQGLNARNGISGIIVQTPVPRTLDASALQSAILPFKDADGFCIENLGRLFSGKPQIIPATPYGIMRLLSHYNIQIPGMHAVVVGRSNTVGKPMAQLLLMEDATVTIAHSKTENLAGITRQADILIAAAGKPNLITEKMVKKGAVVVDVGMNRIGASGKVMEKAESDDAANQNPGRAGFGASAAAQQKSRLIGDVDFDGVSKVAGWISPVPGGVGPMTVASLISNTLACHKLARQ